MEKHKIFDISAEMLSAEARFGDTPAVTKTVTDEESGMKRTVFLSSLHNGTHLCAPAAYAEGAKSLDQYPIERFVGECRVVKAKGDITGAWVEKMSLNHCQRLLIKGEGKGKIDPSAAEELVACGVKLIGIDAPSIALAGMEARVGRILAEGDCLVLENLRLERAQMGTYFLIAPPLLLEGCEAAPCRALLAEDYLYWNR